MGLAIVYSGCDGAMVHHPGLAHNFRGCVDLLDPKAVADNVGRKRRVLCTGFSCSRRLTPLDIGGGTTRFQSFGLPSPRAERKSMKAPQAVRSILLAVFPLLLVLQVVVWSVYLPAAWNGRTDFRCFYVAGYMVRSGLASRLYDYETEEKLQDSLVFPSRQDGVKPFIHLPYEALIFAPFSLMKFRTAYVAFLILNCGLLVASILLLSRVVHDRLPLLLVMAAGFLPFSFALASGQDSIIMLFLLSAALFMLERERNVLAGFLAGLILFRFQIAIPIFLLFLAWRRWKFAAGFALCALTALPLSLALVGLAQARTYAQALMTMSLGSPDAAHIKYNQTAAQMPNFRGFITVVAENHISIFWVHAAILLCSVTLIFWLSRQSPKNGCHAMLMAIPATAMVSYHLYIHDVSLIIIPAALVLLRSVNSRLLSYVGALAAFLAPVCAISLDNLFLAAIPVLLLAVSVTSAESAAES